jgi:hypothetical protein
MSRNTIYIAWAALLLALVAWGVVGLFAYQISTAQADRAALAQKSGLQSSQTSQSIQLHAFVEKTATARAELDALSIVDPASLASTLSTAGKSAGVAITISNALSLNSPAVGSAAPAQAFGFIASAQGSFASVMYAARLLEALPLPSQMQEIQFTRPSSTSGAPIGAAAAAAGSAAGLWQMSAQVKVVTASSISS